MSHQFDGVLQLHRAEIPTGDVDRIVRCVAEQPLLSSASEAT